MDIIPVFKGWEEEFVYGGVKKEQEYLDFTKKWPENMDLSHFLYFIFYSINDLDC